MSFSKYSQPVYVGCELTLGEKEVQSMEGMSL